MDAYVSPKVAQASACATNSAIDFILDCNPGEGMSRRQRSGARKHRTLRSSIALHPFSGGLHTATHVQRKSSARTRSPDDSGPVLAKPPSRLGRISIGGFGGRKSLYTFRSGLRIPRNFCPATVCFRTSTKSIPTIALLSASGQIRAGGGGIEETKGAPRQFRKRRNAAGIRLRSFRSCYNGFLTRAVKTT